jgi:acetyltransferase-like isoleucine patch superfamily enzyme
MQLAALGVDTSTINCSHRLVLKSEAGQLQIGQLVLGNQVTLEARIIIGRNGQLRIGSYCSFRTGTLISCKESVCIGDHVFGAENIFISDNDNHPISPFLRRQMTLTHPGSPAWKLTDEVVSRPLVIEDGVWLGKSAIVLKGVTIGRWSIVAAGAVVTKSVPPFSIVAGNPARVVKTIINDLDRLK